MSMTQLSPEDRSMSETATIPAKNWWSRFMRRLTDLGDALEVTDVDILTARVARLEKRLGDIEMRTRAHSERLT